jgi:hypothetical protein
MTDEVIRWHLSGLDPADLDGVLDSILQCLLTNAVAIN